MGKISIVDIAEIIGLEMEPFRTGKISFNARCPICGDPHEYKLNINVLKNCWRCAKCGSNGGMFDMYARFSMGYNEGEIDKSVRHRAAVELEGLLGLDNILDNQVKVDYSYPVEYIKSDSELNDIYSKLIECPLIALRDKELTMLIGRGLDIQTIRDNGYRSMSFDLDVGIEIPAQIQDATKSLGRYNAQKIKNGLILTAYVMLRYNIQSFEGIPGFYRYHGYWCFNYQFGTMIPVRNYLGEIVGFQVRTESGKLRYITISSGKLPDGTGAKCRVHFPVHNPRINASTKLLLTEGPLKADVSLCLSHKSTTAFVAIMGVNNTKDLELVLDQIKQKGCKSVYNALDMDRLTNPHVLKASDNIKKMVEERGMRWVELYWDRPSAESVLKKQSRYVSVPQSTGSLYDKIRKSTFLIYQKGIKLDHSWPDPERKGIDDYFNTLSKQ